MRNATKNPGKSIRNSSRNLAKFSRNPSKNPTEYVCWIFASKIQCCFGAFPVGYDVASVMMLVDNATFHLFLVVGINQTCPALVRAKLVGKLLPSFVDISRRFRVILTGNGGKSPEYI